MNPPPPTDPQGPHDGDFVGYLKKLEQKQAERLHLPQASPEAPVVSESIIPSDTPLNPFVPEHRALLRARFAEAQKKAGTLGVLQLIQALIGAALLIASLSEEGNIIMLVIGIGLMWGPLARLQRLLHALNPKAPPPASLQNLFGKSKKP